MKQISRKQDNPALTGMFMMISVILSLILTNYINKPYMLSISQGNIAGLSVNFIVNDIFMSIFFLYVGLEIKKEYVIGELKNIKTVMVALCGAIGGIVIPALIYLIINHNDPIGIKGWAIPCATDIAFAVGMLHLFGGKKAKLLGTLLITIAIFDDIFAIAIMILFYSTKIDWVFAIISLVCLSGLMYCNKKEKEYIAYYILLGSVFWLCILKTGIHPTIAGFIVGLVIPYVTSGKKMLIELEHMLTPWVKYMILPVFAFYNSIIDMSTLKLTVLGESVTLAIILALVIGKPVGVTGAIWISIKLKWGKLPSSITAYKDILIIGVLCGIGFTMSLFIGLLAFSEYGDKYLNMVRVGVLTGSSICIFLAWTLFKFSHKKI